MVATRVPQAQISTGENAPDPEVRPKRRYFSAASKQRIQK